ncbi:ABC transporter permease [Paraburkholderia sediminicola]
MRVWRSRLFAGVDSLALLFALLAIWWFGSHSGAVNRLFLPTPEATILVLTTGLRDGTVGAQALATVIRMLIGWLLASIVGIGLGAVIGISAGARRMFQPVLEFVRPLPASALLPLAIAIFGLNANMVLSVVAFGAMWPVLLTTVHGFANVQPRLLEVAHCLRLSKQAFIWKIGIPNATPDILTGMRLSMTTSLTLSVVGEMIASQDGLGLSMLYAARNFRSADLFAGIALVALIGLASNTILGMAERRLLRWQQSQ